MSHRELPRAAPGEYRSFGDGDYYIPAPLPPSAEIEVPESLRDSLEDAIFQLGRLEGVGQDSEASPLLYTTMIRREAVESVLIEGGDVSIEDMFSPSSIESNEKREKSVQEAINYETAIRQGAEKVSETGEITLDLLHQLHRILLDGARGEADYLGEFRRKPINIGAPSASESIFIPPPSHEIDPLMANLLDYIAAGGEYHALLDIGIVHYQFETIHPYGDGNGRLGRVLITLQLIQEGYLQRPYLYPSAYFNEHKIEYVRHMRAVSEEGAWTSWLEFFVDGLAQQARQAIARTDELGKLRREYERDYGHGKTAADRLAMRLFQNPKVDTASVAEMLDVSDQTARNALNELEAAGVLVETTGKQRYKEYEAVDIFAILGKSGGE